MTTYPKEKIQRLCARLDLETQFLMESLEESGVELRESDDHLELGNGSILRLRRLQRICQTLDVEAQVAVLLSHLLERVDELEKELAHARTFRA